MNLVKPKMCHFLVTHCMLNIKECIRFRAPQDLVVLDFQIPRSRPEISSFHPILLSGTKAMAKTGAYTRTKRAKTRASKSEDGVGSRQ